MVLDRRGGTVEHAAVRDLPTYLRPNDCLVLNETRVLPARLSLRRATGGRLDGLFLAESAPGHWQVLLTGGRRLREGEWLDLAGGRWRVCIERRGAGGEFEVRIDPPSSAEQVLTAVGRAPLPPYIKRAADAARADDLRDRMDYQTVYARTSGAVAAPTAGLHLTPELLARLHSAGTRTARLTLHVGRGTFLPVEVEKLSEHPMHAEWYDLPAACVTEIGTARASGGRVVAVGTTVARVLESCAAPDGSLNAGQGWTRLLIAPPYQFRAIDVLLTNFHLPRSTLLALLFAFAGRERVLAAYREAVEQGYRFYSFGDAMLIL